ncbi:MAG: CHAD domain-containing protein [Acidimicrobiia bacterium]|nr:CHAD domain-containing protein [Acidimicrobiia bacterium]
MTTHDARDTLPAPTSVRFFAGETLAEGLDRVIANQFAVALAVETFPQEEQPAAVHETRKALKRLRALLRLVRDTISHDCYHTDNQVLKLIAAELSTVRDTWVMADVLDRLLPHDASSKEAVDILVERLQDRYRAESLALLENKAQMASIVDQLDNVRERSKRWSVLAGEVDKPLPHEFSSIAPGLQRVYKRGRRGMRIIVDSPTDTLLHVWRKRAKYLRHQIEALNVLDPVTMLRYELELEQLTDLLGDDHDLAVLVSRFNTDPALIEDIELDPVLDAIGVKRHELQAKAIDLGRDFFDDPSTDFLDYVAGVWGDGPTF